MFSLSYFFFFQILFLGEGLYYNSLKEEEEKTDRGPERGGGNNKTKQKRIRMEVEAGIECERASCMCCVCGPRCLAWRLTCNAPYFHILNLLDWLLFFPLCNFLFPASYPIFCLPFFSLFVSSSTQVFFLAFLLPSKITLVHTHTQQTVCEETLRR